jgi:hypothetical protein
MSKENYDALKEAIDALPQNEVKTPNMPVGEAVQEAENLYAWCQDDLQALTKAGLDKALVDDLPKKTSAKRSENRRGRQEAENLYCRTICRP